MKMVHVVVLLVLIASVQARYNRLLRVDGINPTCFKRDNCREYDIVGAVITVDKSLPYMGSNYCCLRFNMADEVSLSDYEQDAHFLGRILNSTCLEGDDFITFYEDDFRVVKNVTANDPDPYSIIYFKSPNIAVEFYKDRNFRSRYEILLSIFFNGDSPMCTKETHYRCGASNSSICIDEGLVCDKFPHCPSEIDEDMCGAHHETSMVYDKSTIIIVICFMTGFITLTCLLIFTLCFCKSREKLTDTFMSIFGYKSVTKNSAMLLDHNKSLLRNIGNESRRNVMMNQLA